MSHYPPGTRPADFDDRGAFQGDVDEREVEIRIYVTASMLNHKVAFMSETEIMREVAAEAYLALRKSWHEENDK